LDGSPSGEHLMPGVEDSRVLQAVTAVFTRATWSDDRLALDAMQTIAAVAAAAQPENAEDLSEKLAAAFEQAAAGSKWWLTADGLRLQLIIHRAAAEMCRAAEWSAPAIEEAAVAQIIRSFPPAAAMTGYTYTGVRQLGALLSVGARRQLVAALRTSSGQTQPALPPSVPAPTGVEPISTILVLAAVDPQESEATDWGIESSEAIAASCPPSPEAVLAAHSWLSLGPTPADVVLLSAGWAAHDIRPLRDALHRWAVSLDDEARTGYAITLLRTGRSPRGWLGPAAEAGVDEEQILEEILSQLRAAKNFDERFNLTDAVLELRPTTAKGQQRVASYMMVLLESGKKNDFELACRLGPALGNQHRSKVALSDRLKALMRKNGWAIPDGQRRALEASGLSLGKKHRSLADRLRGR